jgi:hypothetical protein
MERPFIKGAYVGRLGGLLGFHSSYTTTVKRVCKMPSGLVNEKNLKTILHFS